MIRSFWLAGAMFFLLLSGSHMEIPAADSAVVTAPPLANAHAHNDYEHKRPLHDALDQGFTSVEADVFLVEGQLLVAHNFVDVSPERTLEELYLRPLQDLAKKNNGRIYPNGPTVTLLVDIKTNGQAAYTALHELLAKYDSLISKSVDGSHVENAVTVIISGDRPFREIEELQPRRAGIDGRLSDLDSERSASLMPLISDNWTNHFKWRGTGEFSATERDKLKDVVMRTHAKGRRIRFWATPESPVLWKELRAAGVDLIGTDDLAKLSGFLRQP